MGCIPTGELDGAYRKAMQIRGDKGITFPLGAPEIVAAWKEQRKPEIKTSSEAWAMVVSEIHRVHYDGKPEFNDPLVAKVVRQLGWNFLCMGETAAVKFEWAWKEEANAYRGKLELDPNYQLPDQQSNKLLAANTAKLLEAEDVSDGEKQVIGNVMNYLGVKRPVRSFDTPKEAVESMRELLGPPPSKPAQKPLQTYCGNCQYCTYSRPAVALVFYCNHTDSGGREIGIDSTVAPEWCPLQKGS